ncbi:release factor glutamine methyltransferase [Mucilaginibacter yixingensis]|uniref:Release factor glutamine methyltransferase n=1 Tax=Mucilaginibacter yixingensis TaxID=1295612 RepID=A0A2T5JA61_9SPHI|nr:peptide chain release factor N(5)-glutamine methyltransferase [Mucilaginibacter yixingensis]PTQ96937.1 release factor glutamine methyltransferase [Mucilaginibacter yixingensis]
MKTVKDVFAEFKARLSELYATDETDAITSLVLSELIQTNKAKLKAFPELEIPESIGLQLTDILSRLETGEPAQYILGETEFYGLPFKVSPAVLIPRPETEELVQWILDTTKQTPVKTILDIGAGSGCIAIALKKHLPNVQVYAMDVSAAALNIAKQNAVLNEAEVHFIFDDILNPAEQLPQFDIIVSNPPYVTLEDKEQMHRNVTDFEPHTALFVPQDDPLIFYRAITQFAAKKLNSNGYLFFEINENYGEQTIDLINNNQFINSELRKDLTDRDRMTKAQLRG